MPRLSISQTFLATHTPFRNIQYGHSATRELDEQDIRKANEEEFFNEEILARRDSHQFIVVRGNPGSGKSHFIRWLEGTLREFGRSCSTEEVMFISRSQNTLQSALEQIANSGVLRGSIADKDLGMLVEAKQNLK
jgi:ABC-type transport system involved in cytochrome bd biosynthesis fused ATPase/permease subunit